MQLYKLFLLLSAALYASATPIDAEQAPLTTCDGPSHAGPANTKPAALTPSDGPSNAGPADTEVAISRTDVAPTDYTSCSNWYHWNDWGDWIYTEVQFCFTQTGTSTIATANFANDKFYALQWRSAGGHLIYWRVTATISGVDFYTTREDRYRTIGMEYYTFSPPITPTIHSVHIDYYHVGAYWDENAEMIREADFLIWL